MTIDSFKGNPTPAEDAEALMKDLSTDKSNMNKTKLHKKRTKRLKLYHTVYKLRIYRFRAIKIPFSKRGYS